MGKVINLYVSKSIGEKKPKVRKWWKGRSADEDDKDIVVVETSHNASREGGTGASVRLNIVQEP